MWKKYRNSEHDLNFFSERVLRMMRYTEIIAILSFANFDLKGIKVTAKSDTFIHKKMQFLKYQERFFKFHLWRIIFQVYLLKKKFPV